MDNEEDDEEEDAGKAEEVEVDTPQQSISTSGQGYTLEPDETTQEESKQEEPVAEAEQSQGATDEGIMWPS